MKRKFLINNPDHSRLLLFFTGWSTDWRILEGISITAGYDVIVAWDYRDFNLEDFEREYDEMVVMAWSFGVYAAQKSLEKLTEKNNITLLCAINGSLNPVHPEKGIIPEIFSATLDNLDERNLERFRLRMCGGKKSFLEKSGNLPIDSNIDELIDELKVFRDNNDDYDENDYLRWDCAFISSQDTIFPSLNLANAWSGVTKVILRNSYHLPDFSKIINKVLRNKNLISRNFSRHHSTYNDYAIVQNRLSAQLAGWLKENHIEANKILEVGSGTGFLSKKLYSLYPLSNITLLDLPDSTLLELGDYISGDAEVILTRIEDKSYDLIASASTLQWLHSPKKFINQSYRLLEKGGFLVVNYFTEGNCFEVADLTSNSLLYHDGNLLLRYAESIGFKIIVKEQQTNVLKFHTPSELLNHLRATGVNGLSGKTLSYRETKELMSKLPVDNEGLYSLTYVSFGFLLQKIY